MEKLLSKFKDLSNKKQIENVVIFLVLLIIVIIVINSLFGEEKETVKEGPKDYDKLKYYKVKGSDYWIRQNSISGYDTGGYTGDWKSSEGRLAFLHQKELVLNAKDTENMLKMLDISRSMTSVMSSVSNKIKDMIYQIDKANYIRNMNSRTQLQDISNQLEQKVHIEATFPNVSQSHEIEDAFADTTNLNSELHS